MKIILRNFAWILAVSLGTGLLLSLLDGGTFWISWLAYSLILTIGSSVLVVLWYGTGTTWRLGLILILALSLRIALGMAFSYVLPTYGNDNVVQKAGYIFRDSFSRDSQAWSLANSSASLWSVFEKSSTADQYGGMLFLSGWLYRFLSPDSHRPWLIILVGALVAAIGILLAWKAARKSWSEPVAWGIAWILALYPESILFGSAQMREPFLMTFVSMVFWGVVNWQDNWRTSAAWLAGGMAGMLLFNPSVAVAAIIVLAVWVWIRGKGLPREWGWWIAGGAVVGFLAIFLFTRAVGSSLPFQGTLVDNLLNWFRFSSAWDASLLEQHSGWIQNVFTFLPASLHFPFIVGYGITQPLLPAAIADPAVWPMRVLGIVRGLGWYALLPFLVYSLRPIWKMQGKRERFSWLWLWIAVWGWIILSSARAGGDQWDNPRYRIILLLFQAALAAQTITWQRASRDHWLGRFLVVEGIFLGFFGYWYAARYSGWKAGQVHVLIIIALIAFCSAVIIVGGWIKDHRRVQDA
jgi:hypothetical protein